ncbi:hypothetical protein ABT010_04320 [Streptomyces sp. NPDC002668]|uniref:hypothetical protein n=1 Tax=Streptomyces sp. NPDC002668 TaxID=3154422 RepID=UPI00331E8259
MAVSVLAAVPQAVNLLDAGSLLSAFGARGIAAVLFAETGLLAPRSPASTAICCPSWPWS